MTSSTFRRSRRRFLSLLGLTVGARVLAPVAALLHREAWGQTAPTSKKVVFITMGAGLPNAHLGIPQRRAETDWSFHPSLSPLEPWKQRLAILDGLNHNVPGSQHTAGYGFFSCVPTEGGNADAGGSPGGQTIDQLLGERLGQGTTLRTLLFGIDKDERRLTHQSLYAAGKNQPVPYPARASVLFNRLFPNAVSNQAQALADARILTRLADDVRRVRQNLAGQERQKFEGYLGALESFDRRRTGLTCPAPASPSAERGVVAEFPAMLSMAALALKCGVTNVVAGNIGGGNEHSSFPHFIGPHVGTVFEAQGFIGSHGHDPTYLDARDITWRWLSERVADFLRDLEAPLPDGRRLIDEVVVVVSSDSGPDHHNGKSQRFIVIGDAGGALRTQGRFLQFPPNENWGNYPLPPTARTVNSLYTALATALGAPMDTFGRTHIGGTSAPLLELLA